MQAMRERDLENPLQGRVEKDDAYWGGNNAVASEGEGLRTQSPLSRRLRRQRTGGR
jgi:hypothetical protein